MYSSSLIVLALAVFGASAQTFVSSGCGLGCGLGCSPVNTCSGAVGTTPVTENLPIRLPGLVAPTSVQDTCSCIKTIVRPQFRKEVFNIPSVQRFYQTTSTPIVENVPYVRSGAVDIPSCDPVVGNGFVGTGLVGTGLVGSGLVGSGLVGSGLVGSGLVGSGLVGSGLVGSGCVGTGVVGTGLVGSGCVGTGVVGTGLVGSGLVGSGCVGTGLVGTGCGGCVY